MLDEFKKFILRGNVLDLAVGVIVGGAFGAITKSLVDDVLMPAIGLATGGVTFSDKFLVLKTGDKPEPYATLQAAKDAHASVMAYGTFVNNIVTFLIVSFAVFMLVKAVNRLLPPVVAVETTRECPRCALTIAKKATRCGHCTSEVPAAG